LRRPEGVGVLRGILDRSFSFAWALSCASQSASRSATSLGLDRIVRCQTGQRFIERRQVLRRRPHQRLGPLQIDALPIAAMFEPFLAPGILHQDAANGLGGGGEEMAAMVPVLAVGCADQPEVSLMNERGRLQGVARRLVGQPSGGETAQLFVDEREQVGSSLAVPGRRCVQK